MSRGVVLAAVLSLGFAPAPLPKPIDGKSELKKMQGTWMLTAYRFEGREP